MISYLSNSIIKEDRDWRARLNFSRDLGTGFAAPGGEFTRALYEWSFTPDGSLLKNFLMGRRVVELGAGMMPYGYALASACGAKNFVGVEPFYGDILARSIKAYIHTNDKVIERIPYKVVQDDMLAYLSKEPDDLLCVLACGIEDCILPDQHYRKRVENEIVRTLEGDCFFLSSHSDLFPQSLKYFEMTFRRPLNTKVIDRLRLHGSCEAFEKYELKYI